MGPALNEGVICWAEGGRGSDLTSHFVGGLGLLPTHNVAPETVVLGHLQKQQDKKMRDRSIYELLLHEVAVLGATHRLWPSTSLKVLFLLYQNH